MPGVVNLIQVTGIAYLSLVKESQQMDFDSIWPWVKATGMSGYDAFVTWFMALPDDYRMYTYMVLLTMGGFIIGRLSKRRTRKPLDKVLHEVDIKVAQFDARNKEMQARVEQLKAQSGEMEGVLAKIRVAFANAPSTTIPVNGDINDLRPSTSVTDNISRILVRLGNLVTMYEAIRDNLDRLVRDDEEAETEDCNLAGKMEQMSESLNGIGEQLTAVHAETMTAVREMSNTNTESMRSVMENNNELVSKIVESFNERGNGQ